MQKHLWKIAWSQKAFRYKTITGVLLNLIILALFPSFFQHIEKRNGVLLHDALLNYIKPLNVSFYIFIIIWVMALITLIRSIQQPYIFLTFIFSFFILNVSRIITISLLPLEPPKGLIPMVDPITSIFYGQSFITKDLFYSGHVATQFLMFLCFTKKSDKLLATISTISISILVLLQHVHYTIDVIAAPFFAYACFVLARYIASKFFLRNAP